MLKRRQRKQRMKQENEKTKKSKQGPSKEQTEFLLANLMQEMLKSFDGRTNCTRVEKHQR